MGGNGRTSRRNSVGAGAMSWSMELWCSQIPEDRLEMVSV